MQDLTDLLGDFNEQDTSNAEFLKSVISSGEMRLKSSLKDIVELPKKKPELKSSNFITQKSKKSLNLKKDLSSIKNEDTEISKQAKQFVKDLDSDKQTEQIDSVNSTLKETKKKSDLKSLPKSKNINESLPVSGLNTVIESTEEKEVNQKNILEENDLTLETKQFKADKDAQYTPKKLPFEKDYLLSTKDLINKEQLLDILNDTYFTYLSKYSDFNLFAPKERGMLSSLGGGLFKIVSKFFGFLFKKPLIWLGKFGLKKFKGGLTKVWGTLRQGLDWIVNKIMGFFKGIKEFVSKVLGKIWNFIKGIGQRLGELIKGAAKRISEMFKWLGDKFNSLFSRFKEGWNNLKNSIKGITSKISEKFNGLKDGLKGIGEAIKSKFNGLLEHWKSFKESFIKTFNKGKEKIGKGLKVAGEKFTKGKELLQKGTSKLKSGFSKVTNFAKKVLPKGSSNIPVKASLGKGLGFAGKLYTAYEISSGGISAAKDIKELGLSGLNEKYRQEAKNMSVGDMLSFKNVFKIPWIAEELTSRALKKIQPEKLLSNLSDKITGKLKDVRDSTICAGCSVRKQLELLQKEKEQQDSQVKSLPQVFKEDGENLPFSNFQVVQGG